MAFPKKKLQGLVAATITPMTENGEINFPVIGQYVDYLVKEQGVKNIFVNGTTGEGLSLSISERRQVAEEWVRQGKNKLDQVVIHVGALNLKESQELAQHAAEIGADGIAVIAPFFFKSQNKDALISFLREVAAAAPALPFYYYHIPSLTGVKNCMGRGIQSCVKRPPREWYLMVSVAVRIIDVFVVPKFVLRSCSTGFRIRSPPFKD